MKEDIYNFSKQLRFNPEIKNEKNWGNYDNYLLLGMGGSHLQGDLFKAVFPDFSLSLYQDYGIPSCQNTGVIAASYSGSTEEVLDSLSEALERNIPVAVISKGGDLLQIAKEKGLPYIKLPEDDIQPRLGLGFAFKALLKILRVEGVEEELQKTAETLEGRKEELEEEGKELALKLRNRLPIVYATRRNSVLASIWKINFNETAKVPSFYNLIPELNHNEMTSFDTIDSTKSLSEKMIFLHLKDKEDHLRNRRRMEVLKEVLEKRNFEVLEVELEGEKRIERTLSSIVLSTWVSFYLSDFYGTEPNDVPMVEEFKKLIK